MFGAMLNCGNCLFFESEYAASVEGACRRYPPTVDAISGDSALPQVIHLDWCGEHKLKFRVAADREGDDENSAVERPDATPPVQPWYEVHPVEQPPVMPKADRDNTYFR